MYHLIADTAEAAQVAVTEGISNGNIALAIAGGLAITVPIVLKAVGVNVPGLDPIFNALLGVAARLGAKKAIDPAKKEADLQKIADAVRKSTEGK